MKAVRSPTGLAAVEPGDAFQDEKQASVGLKGWETQWKS